MSTGKKREKKGGRIRKQKKKGREEMFMPFLLIR